MPFIANGESALRRLFTALVEQTFQTKLAVADPSLTDYLAELLCRFVRCDAFHRHRDPAGRKLIEVADLMAEAEQRQAGPRREIYRHIGDVTLFWSGVYPEALPRLQAPSRKDHLLNYCEQGRRSYYIASTFVDGPYAREAAVLRRLSDEFELCSIGLNQVRREWESMAIESSNGSK